MHGGRGKGELEATRTAKPRKLKPHDPAKNSINAYNLALRGFAMLVLRILAVSGISGNISN
jgi:hypothetical protein